MAREACTKDIKVVRYKSLCIFRSYITERNFTIIGKICFLCLCVPFRRKHTLTSEVLESHSETTDAGEKVNESEFWIFRTREGNIEKIIKQAILKSVRFTYTRGIAFDFAWQFRVSPSVDEFLRLLLKNIAVLGISKHTSMGNNGELCRERNNFSVVVCSTLIVYLNRTGFFIAQIHQCKCESIFSHFLIQ